MKYTCIKTLNVHTGIVHTISFSAEALYSIGND